MQTECKKNTDTIVTRPLSRSEAYERANGERLNKFLDRNGYTVRETRGIARNAIIRWETQKTCL